MNDFRAILPGVALGLFLSVAAASATIIQTPLDAATSSPTWGGTSGAQYQNVGQTFTLQPGQDTVLDSITCYIDDYAERSSSHSPFNFRLYVYAWDTSYNRPDPAKELFRSEQLTTNGLAGWQIVTVPIGGLELQTGTEYVWFLSSVGEGNTNYGTAYIGFAYSDPYPFGTMRVGSGYLGLSGMSGTDMAFVMTLSAVPEPTGLVLLASAALGLVLKRRAR